MSIVIGDRLEINIDDIEPGGNLGGIVIGWMQGQGGRLNAIVHLDQVLTARGKKLDTGELQATTGAYLQLALRYAGSMWQTSEGTVQVVLHSSAPPYSVGTGLWIASHGYYRQAREES